MERKNDFCSEMLSALNAANSFLLCTHVSPDGDAIGATLAMGLALKSLGKQVTMSCVDPVPHQMTYLPGADEMVQLDALDGKEFDAAMAIDCADVSRMGDCAQAFSAAQNSASSAAAKGLPRSASTVWLRAYSRTGRGSAASAA